MKPKLSIIIPCYKVEPYLRRCLDSLLSQSLDGLELVCINDGSPDGCLSVLREYERRQGHGGVCGMIVIDQENRGVWKARRRGIEAASGEYIGFIDPDDYVKPDFAKKLYEAAKTHDADIACCGYDRTDADTGRVYSREMTRFPYEVFDFRREPGLMTEVNIAIWNKIYRAGLLKEMGDIARVPGVLDDLFFSQLICMNARRIAFVKDSLVCYMVRKNSIISSMREEHIAGVYEAAEELREVFDTQRPGLRLYLDAVMFLNLGVSLMHRASAHGGRALGHALKENRAFLDARFPRWRGNPYFSPSYVLAHRGANLKTCIVNTIYRLHLIRPFLLIYGKMTGLLGIDIKW